MADLAITFHWAPGDMDLMSLSELMGWRQQAARRTEQTEKPGGKTGKTR
jgi:hypothetical protein